MSSSGGRSNKQRSTQTGALKKPWSKDSPGTPIYNTTPTASPRAPGSGKSSGKVSSFMRPTAASSSKAKANIDSHMSNLFVRAARSTAQLRADGKSNASTKSGQAVDWQAPKSQLGQPLRGKSSEVAIAGTRSTQNFEEHTLDPIDRATEGTELLSRPTTADSRFVLIPGLGLDIGHLVTPPEFYNRPPSSVGVYVPDNRSENLEPEWVQDLRRMVSELDTYDKNGITDIGSVYGSSEPPGSSGTMGIENGQPRGQESQSYENIPPEEFEGSNTEPDPEHNIVIIIGHHNIGFSLNVDAILDHSPVIAHLVEELGDPVEGEMRELVFSDIDPYGFFYVLKALFTSVFPTLETAGPQAEALMLDAALSLQMYHIVCALRIKICEKLRDETLDIEVALRFANVMFKHSTNRQMRDFWRKDAFVRCALRQTSVADLIDRSPGLFDDRTWIVPGFKHGLIELLGKTHLRV